MTIHINQMILYYPAFKKSTRFTPKLSALYIPLTARHHYRQVAVFTPPKCIYSLETTHEQNHRLCHSKSIGTLASQFSEILASPSEQDKFSEILVSLDYLKIGINDITIFTALRTFTTICLPYIPDRQIIYLTHLDSI